jgi:hypothetical protein
MLFGIALFFALIIAGVKLGCGDLQPEYKTTEYITVTEIINHTILFNPGFKCYEKMP